MTMRAGRLTHPIAIERSTIIIDDAGVPRATWSTLAEVRAEIVEATKAETQHASGARTETAITFRLRYVAGITLADRILHAGQPHDIVELVEIGRRRGLEIKVRKVGL